VPQLRFSDAARDDLVEITRYIAEVGGEPAAARFAEQIIAKCEHVASLPGLLGRGRPELRSDIRSIAFKNYLVFFRYLPSAEKRDGFEVVSVVERHRDLEAYFREDE
jgi:plasmid stabilization system protein ParE